MVLLQLTKCKSSKSSFHIQTVHYNIYIFQSPNFENIRRTDIWTNPLKP